MNKLISPPHAACPPTSHSIKSARREQHFSILKVIDLAKVNVKEAQINKILRFAAHTK